MCRAAAGTRCRRQNRPGVGRARLGVRLEDGGGLVTHWERRVWARVLRALPWYSIRCFDVPREPIGADTSGFGAYVSLIGVGVKGLWTMGSLKDCKKQQMTSRHSVLINCTADFTDPVELFVLFCPHAEEEQQANIHGISPVTAHSNAI